MHFHCFVHLLCWNFLDDGGAAFRLPRVLLHQQDVDERVEIRTFVEGVLDWDHLRTIDANQAVEHLVVVALLRVQLVHEEDDGLAQLLRVAEVVLSADLWPILTIDEQQGCVSHMQGCHRCTYEVISSRTVDDVQLLVVPLHMENGGENTIAVFLFHWEVVTHGILLGDATTTADNSCFIQKCFGKSGLTGTVIAKQGNVLDFVRLVNFHC